MAQVSAVFGDPGQDKVIALLAANATVKYLGWGSGSTAAAVAQTTLVSANPEARTTGVISNPASNTHRVIGVIEATAARDAAEVGVFDAATNGNMCMRGTYTPKSLIAGDQVRFTIDGVAADSSEV